MTDKNNNFFLHQFAIQKLANYLQINPSEINYLAREQDLILHQLEYNGQRYIIKMANPSRVAKDDLAMVWDFDMRNNTWEDGKSVKIDRGEKICEYYILIGIKDGVAASTFLIPFDDSPASHIRIAVDGESKYKRYSI